MDLIFECLLDIEFQRSYTRVNEIDVQRSSPQSIFIMLYISLVDCPRLVPANAFKTLFLLLILFGCMYAVGGE